MGGKDYAKGGIGRKDRSLKGNSRGRVYQKEYGPQTKEGLRKKKYNHNKS